MSKRLPVYILISGYYYIGTFDVETEEEAFKEALKKMGQLDIEKCAKNLEDLSVEDLEIRD